MVATEKPESELKRLIREQDKTEQDEVFGGLLPAARAAYNRKAKRINELEIQLSSSAFAEKNLQSAKAEQKRQWNKKSETDTPQSKSHQRYRSREEDSKSAAADASGKRGKGKNEPEEKGGE